MLYTSQMCNVSVLQMCFFATPLSNLTVKLYMLSKGTLTKTCVHCHHSLHPSLIVQAGL